MKKLIIIGAGLFQYDLIIKAKSLGYQTHVFAWEDGAIAKSVSDYFYPISITEKEDILKIAEKINPAGVVTSGSDLAVISVNFISEKLNLRGNSVYSSLISTNKFEMRKVLSSDNIPVPEYFQINSKSDLDAIPIVEKPYIIKPVDRSGSRGVVKIKSKKDLTSAYRIALDSSFSKKVILEEFVEGKEYSMEMISIDRKHYHLATTEKFTTGAPNFIETAHLQPARIDKTIESNAIEIIKKSLDALQIVNGASHSEFKVTKDGSIFIIEIGARMAGDFIGSSLVNISTGHDYLKYIIEVACGIEPDLLESKTINTGFVKFIYYNEDISNYIIIKDNSNISVIKESENISLPEQKVSDSSTRGSYYIIKTNTIENIAKLIQLEEYKYN